MQRIEEVAAAGGESVEMAHGWKLFSVAPVELSQVQAALAGPAAAVPEAAARRLGMLRFFAVPYLACGGRHDFVSADPPAGETHSSVWLETAGGRDVFLSFLDANEHDVGFELLAAVGELLVPRFTEQEFKAYAALLGRELKEAVAGEIDQEALEAKETAADDYPSVSLASTLAEYMHALWHDVEVRQGPLDLPTRFLRRRFELLREIFPPNPGYVLFKR
jgi:hypothetical protein